MITRNRTRRIFFNANQMGSHGSPRGEKQEGKKEVEAGNDVRALGTRRWRRMLVAFAFL